MFHFGLFSEDSDFFCIPLSMISALRHHETKDLLQLYCTMLPVIVFSGLQSDIQTMPLFPLVLWIWEVISLISPQTNIIASKFQSLSSFQGRYLELGSLFSTTHELPKKVWSHGKHQAMKFPTVFYMTLFWKLNVKKTG